MTKKLLTLSVSLLALLPVKSFSSDHRDLIDPPEPTPVCAPIQGPGRVTDQDLTRLEANRSTWHVYTLENGPLSSELLLKGYLQFSQRGLLGDWMYFIHHHTKGPCAARHIDHLALIARLLAPRGVGVDSQHLEKLFHQNTRMMTGAECLLMPMKKLAHTQQAHDYLSPENLQVRQTLIKGAQILAQGYVERIIAKRDTLTSHEARYVLRLFKNMQSMSTSDEFYRESDWYQSLAKQILEKTPALTPMGKITFIGLAHFAKSSSFPGLLPKEYAKELVDFVTPLLADPVHLQYSNSWMYPVLSKAYFSLNMPTQCLKTWREYQRNTPRGKVHSPKDALDGLGYMSRFSKDSQEIYFWWNACVNFQTAYNHYPSYSAFELRARDLMASAFVDLSPCEAENILRQTLAYLDGDGAPLLEGPHGQTYRMQRLETLINLGRVLTRTNRHDDAAQLYFTIASELGQNFCRLGNFRLTPVQEARIRKTLKSEYTTLIAMYNNHLPQQEHTQDPKTTQGLPPMAQAAQLHLKRTFEQSIFKTLGRVQDMMNTCGKFEDGSVLLEKLQGITYEGEDLRRTLGNIGETAPPSASSSSSQAASSSGHAAPTLVTFRRLLNAFDENSRRIETGFRNAHGIHKTNQRKEVEAYVRSLRSADETLTHLTLATTPHKPKAPMGRGKQKKRGSSAASSSAPTASSAAPSSHGPQSADLLMGKKAQSDYASLPAKLRDKFHTLAQEISSKPYQIIGGQGRPERLVTGAGTYLSRRLTDSDRVVYEVAKDADGAVRVIFVSLLGHYKHLARHQESASGQLLRLDG